MSVSLTEIDRDEARSMGRKPSPNTLFAQEAIGEFEKSGAECAMVDGWPDQSKNAAARSMSLKDAIHRAGLSGRMSVFTRRGKVFIERRPR